MTHIELSVGLHEGNLSPASSSELSRSASTAAPSWSDIAERQQSSHNCNTSTPAAAPHCGLRKPRASSVRGRAAFFEAMIASPRSTSPPYDPCASSSTSPPGCPAVSKHALGLFCFWVFLPCLLRHGAHTCLLRTCKPRLSERQGLPCTHIVQVNSIDPNILDYQIVLQTQLVFNRPLGSPPQVPLAVCTGQEVEMVDQGVQVKHACMLKSSVVF